MEQAQYDQILILGKKYMRGKKIKKGKKRQKGYIPKYLQWWSLGVGNTGYLFCLYVLFLVVVCFLVSKYSFIKREKNQSL